MADLRAFIGRTSVGSRIDVLDVLDRLGTKSPLYTIARIPLHSISSVRPLMVLGTGCIPSWTLLLLYIFKYQALAFVLHRESALALHEHNPFCKHSPSAYKFFYFLAPASPAPALALPPTIPINLSILPLNFSASSLLYVALLSNCLITPSMT